MDNGWIKIHRKFLEWEWFKEPHMVQLFIYFMLLANHEKGRWQGQEIKRGQFITGLESLEKQTGISRQSIRTCINRLKSTGEITSISTNKFRIITIVNYDYYQKDDRQSTNKLTYNLTNNQQSTNNQLTANNNNNNNKKNKNNTYTVDFEEFWKIYPKRVGKPKSFANWKELSLEEHKQIMEDIPKRLNDSKWKGGFIKDPERY